MSNYWERRAVWDLYKNLDDAEATADLIAKVYRTLRRTARIVLCVRRQRTKKY